jgi:hypothetical protein
MVLPSLSAPPPAAVGPLPCPAPALAGAPGEARLAQLFRHTTEASDPHPLLPLLRAYRAKAASAEDADD